VRELGILTVAAAGALSAVLLVVLALVVRSIARNMRETRQLDHLIADMEVPREERASLVRACLSNSIAVARARTMRGTSTLASVASPIGLEETERELAAYLEAIAGLAITDPDVTRHAFRRFVMLVAEQASEHGIAFVVAGARGERFRSQEGGSLSIYQYGQEVTTLVSAIGAEDIPHAWSLIDEDLVLALEDLCSYDEERSPALIEFVREHAWAE